jgi:hypothetical protein
MSDAVTAVQYASRVIRPGSRRVVGIVAAGLLAAGVISGCGGSGRAASTTSSSTTGMITTPPTPKVSARVKAQERAIHHQVLVSLSQHSKAPYGALPADLRNRQKPPPYQTLHSSIARPADPIQGIAVHLRLDGARALATAVGPHVPTKDQGTFDLHTPATWDVTFVDVHGRFPLSPSMFTLTDQEGQTLHPSVATAQGRPLPKVVPRGRSFTVRLKSDLFSEGDGKLRYSPVGGHLLVEWDFDVETD